MKRNVFVAMLLAVIMVVSCMTLMVSAKLTVIVDNGKAGASSIGYVPVGSVPTIDGDGNEKAWGSTNTFGDVTVLWGEDGFYFKTGLNASFKYTDLKGDTEKTVTVTNGAVTGLPAGSTSAAGSCVEMFAPYTYAFTWEYHNYVQYRTKGNDHFDPTTLIAKESGAIMFDIEKASDLIGNIITINGADVQMAGPYCYNYIMGGFNYDTTGNDEGSQGTGQTQWEGGLMPDGVTKLPRYGYLAAQLAYATQVTDETAPIIDGVIDDVWANTAKIRYLSEIDNPERDAYGYASVLWSTEGLYLLACIKDPNVCEKDDANISISEYTVRANNEYVAFPGSLATMYPTGTYQIYAKPDGTIDGSGAFLEAMAAPDSGIKSAVKVTATGYQAELFVPYFKLTAEDAKVGHIMSMCGSVDNWLPGGASRDEYVNFGEYNCYWDHACSSFDVVFVGEFDVPEAPATMSEVAKLVENLLASYVKSTDALTETDVNKLISKATSDTAESVEEMAEIIEGLADTYATKADLAAIDVSAALTDYAKTADVDAKIDAKIAGIEVKDYTAVIVILFVLVVLEAAGIAFVFIKKK